MNPSEDTNPIIGDFNPISKDVNSAFERNVRECKTVKSKQGVFKAVNKPTAIKIPKDCVNDQIYEKDGEKYCISAKGNNVLKCDYKGKNQK